jgi:hypothetical protein
MGENKQMRLGLEKFLLIRTTISGTGPKNR